MQIEAALATLTLEDKVTLLTGADAWSLHPMPQIGLRRVVVSDGPVGVRGETWDEANTSANLPSPTAVAATWDVDLVHRLGGLLAAEARRKGVDVLLAPTVNLHRSPLGGRHFECYSEDPLLTARIGSAYVRGVQAGGVGTTVKHFVGNDSETRRMTYDARIDERALREVYLAPFEAMIVDADAWAVMAAYNRVNGHTMTESPLLDDVLKAEWGFPGAVMSDWTAARSTVESANAGLDLVMPGPTGPWGKTLLDAVRDGKVEESRIDDKVRRLLTLAARVGALEGHPPPAAPPAFGSDEISTALRQTAVTSFVLAHNEDAVLPLDPAGLNRVAVLGPNAEPGRPQGGGSATVFPPYTISPHAGVRAALGPETEVTYARGAKSSPYLTPIAGEFTVRFLDVDGTELGAETRHTGRMLWLGSFGDGVPSDQVAAVEVTVELTSEISGEHRIGVCGVGPYTVRADGEVVLDTTLELDDPTEPFLAVVRPPQATIGLALEAGRTVSLQVRHEVAGPFAVLAIGHEAPGPEEDEELEHAVALAAEADVAIVVVGTTAEVESEGFDRDVLTLPGAQDELVRRVAQVCPRTVVVVNAGAPVEMPWAEDVGAVMLSWFGGQEYGHALADVLFGEAEPGGRLPTTWPRTASDCPVLSTTPDDSDTLPYAESIHVGYRGWQRARRIPRYPFGHGLGYTDWEYGTAEPVGTDRIRLTVRNTGLRRGRTVVQAYASRPGSGVERPVSWLVGFRPVEAEPGETVETELEIPTRALEHWALEHWAVDAPDGSSGWRLETGRFEIAVGASSEDLRTHTFLEL